MNLKKFLLKLVVAMLLLGTTLFLATLTSIELFDVFLTERDRTQLFLAIASRAWLLAAATIVAGYHFNAHWMELKGALNQ